MPALIDIRAHADTQARRVLQTKASIPYRDRLRALKHVVHGYECLARRHGAEQAVAVLGAAVLYLPSRTDTILRRALAESYLRLRMAVCADLPNFFTESQGAP